MATSLPSFGFNTAAPTATTPALNFGSGGNATPGLSFGANPNTSITTSTSTGLSLGSLPSSTAGQSTTFNFPTSSVTTSQPAQQSPFSFASNALPGATTAPNAGEKKVTFNLTPTVVASASSGTLGQPSISTGLTSSTQGMTFSELEENLNKWQIMIDEHQRLFHTKVHALNATDTLLYKNRIKLEKLNALTDQASAKQKALNEELNFVSQQQKELDESVTSLESHLEKLESDSPGDTERFQTYKLADSLDLQIKKMNEELKRIIDSTNDQNKSQDLTDPVSRHIVKEFH
uniref:Nuclear pore glycoprotein p62 n=1 Tax=Cacopsylla melanoneura TaxID=428564 RepID=A0A8D9FAN4_9HEMI